MKKIKLILATATILLVTISAVPLKSTAQVSVNFQVFYDNLAPYGNWVNYPGYGYAWVPGVGVGFRPYVTGGHWAYSDAGWVWVSNYDWGWAPFHYGSWIEDPAYGWIWIPGYDWAPAWVTWGSYNGYYGWAPVSPGFSISVGYYPPMSRWCFIEPRYMTASDWGNHYYVAHNNRIVINNTVIINNEHRISSVSNTANYGGRAYYAGPPRQEFERTAHTTVTPVSLRTASNPGRTQVTGNAVNIYRPAINPGTKIASRPARVASPDQLKAARTMPAGQTRSAAARQAAPAINHAAPSTNNARSSGQMQHSTAPAQRPQSSAPQMQRNVQQRAATPQQRPAVSPQLQHQASKPQSVPQQRQAVPRQAAPAPAQGEQHGEGRGPRNFR